MSSISPLMAVNSTREGREVLTGTRERKEEKKMDVLSLVAYISTMAGVASFFFVPVASLILLPAGLIMGMIGFLGGRKRYESRRGRGLALASLVLGGAFTLMLFASFIAFGLFGF